MGSSNVSWLPTFSDGIRWGAAKLKWVACGTRPYRPPRWVGTRSTRVPNVLRLVSGGTAGNVGSSNVSNLPTFPDGVLWGAADSKWVAGGTRPYRLISAMRRARIRIQWVEALSEAVESQAAMSASR